MTNYCNAKTRSGGNCKQPAGWGTDHVGEGKCKLHGGSSLKGIESPRYETGRYSKYVPAKLQTYIADLDQYNILELADELQTQRALIADYLSRYRDGLPMQEQNIGTIIAWLNSIGITVERITKIRNETALTGAEIAHLKLRTAELVTRYIDDPEKRRQFVKELFQISEPAQLE